MSQDKRPLSPFMIGPYYRPQITSVLSILHRMTGVLLSVIGLPLALWWLVALGQGPEAYARLQACLDGILGQLVLIGLLFSLSYHFFNGIRHLVWDAGRGFEMKTVHASGWVVVVLTVLATGVLGAVIL